MAVRYKYMMRIFWLSNPGPWVFDAPRLVKSSKVFNSRLHRQCVFVVPSVHQISCIRISHAAPLPRTLPPYLPQPCSVTCPRFVFCCVVVDVDNRTEIKCYPFCLSLPAQWDPGEKPYGNVTLVSGRRTTSEFQQIGRGQQGKLREKIIK